LDWYNSTVRVSWKPLILAVLTVASAAICAAQSPSLENVKTVYLWPMRHSLDQYLAEQLSGGGPFQVVVDPKLADAIITERIDAPFLKAMDELFANTSDKAGKPEASASASGSVEDGLQAPRPANRPMGQPSGTVFLVHAASRKVLWSTFINQQDFLPKNLHRQARDVVGRLKKETAPHE
jgi:hypothetical protein